MALAPRRGRSDGFDGENLLAEEEFDFEVLEKSDLAEKSEAHLIHSLRKTRIDRKDDTVTKVDGNGIPVGGVCAAAHSARKPFGQAENVELQENRQSQGKQTGIGP